MKISRYYRPIALYSLMLVMLAALPGFKNMPAEFNIPAPIESPNFALYHNFAISGIYSAQDHSAPPFTNVCREISRFLPENHQWLSLSDSERSQLLSQTLINSGFRPEEMFFFFADSTNFALLINGNFNLAQIEQMIPGCESIDDNNLLIKNLNEGKTPLQLQVRTEQILLCPLANSPTIIDRLQNRQNNLPQKFSAFTSMMKGRPALATEIDFASFAASLASSGIELPSDLKTMQHLRLIADNQLTKMQLFLPEAQARQKLAELLKPDFFNSLISSDSSFKINENGKSVFVETDASSELEQVISQKFAGLLMHFVIKHRADYLSDYLKEPEMALKNE
ncbi:MAG: hypothetical protein AB1403_15460 [Candidatus Riflebacteria bacterium]